MRNVLELNGKTEISSLLSVILRLRPHIGMLAVIFNSN